MAGPACGVCSQRRPAVEAALKAAPEYSRGVTTDAGCMWTVGTDWPALVTCRRYACETRVNQTAAQVQGMYQAAMTQAQFSAGVATELAAPILAFTKTFF